MAKVTSGSFNTGTKNSRYLTFSWTCTQDTAKNETTINWTLKCNGTATNYNKSAPFYVEIDGEQVYYSTERIQLYVGTVVTTGTKTLTHNADGSRSFSAKVKAAIYDASYNVSGSGSWELKDIPRGAVITKVPTTFTDEDSPTVEFTNYLGNSVDSISICLSLDNYYSTIPYRAIGKTDKSYTFNFTDAEKAKIYEYTKNTNSLSVSFYILTVIDGEEYRSKMYSTLKIVNAEPEISSFEVKDIGAASTALTGNGNTMISGFNYITAKATPVLKKGAEIVDSYIKNTHYNVIEGLEGVFENVGVETFEAVLIDSRGYEVSKKVTLNYIDYIPLTCNVDAEIHLSETNTEKAEVECRVSGNYFNGSFGAVNNTLSIKIECNGSDGGYAEDIVELTSENFDGNTYEATIPMDNLSYKESWVAKVIVTDYITKATKESKTLTALPVFDWSKDDFNFNVPVTFSAGIDLPQKLLHTDGGRYMHETQSVVLSGEKALSKQTNGYLLVWYDYSTATMLAKNINYTFIPKYMLIAANAKITMPLISEDGATVGAKTVSVSETNGATTIQGDTINDLKETDSKIKVYNWHWVLRYIIGV